MKSIYKLLFFSAIAVLMTSCNEQKSPFALQKEMLNETEKLEKDILVLRETVVKSDSKTAITQQYKKTKLQYKNVEWALEYFLPEILNSGDESLSETEKNQGVFFPPKDFSKLDKMVETGSDKSTLLQEIDNLQRNNNSTIAYLDTIEMGETALSDNE